jgi:hypothetical protein
MADNVRDVINARWKFADVPRLKPIRAALDVALNARDAVREKHAALAKNSHLSPIGRLDDVRSFVSKSTAPAIHKARKTVSTARDELAKWKDRLKPAAPDPKNVSAAVLRSEMRTQLRGLSNAARTALLLTENPDPMLVQAVLEAPGFSSGVADDIRARMLEAYATRNHPEELAWIAESEEALELLEAATSMVLNAAQSVTEFPSDKLFNDFIDVSAPVVTGTADASEEMKALGALAKEFGIKSMGPEGIEYHDIAS